MEEEKKKIMCNGCGKDVDKVDDKNGECDACVRRRTVIIPHLKDRRKDKKE